MMDLKRATFEDLGEVVALEKQVMAFPWNESHFQAELEKPFSSFLLVKNASFLIGYVIFWKIFDECEILNLVVHPEWRRKKIASFLMKKVMSEVFFSGDAKKISLDVRADNPSGIAFYKKMGFFQEQVQKCFTTDQKDALRMIFYRNKA